MEVRILESGNLNPGQRQLWLAGEDKLLLGQCEIDTYRASGPGGQKRNKTSSAVRLRHLPSGLIAISEDSRSQHENKAWALRRLRRDICIKLREPSPDPFSLPENLAPFLSRTGIHISPKNEHFFPLGALVLDLLEKHQGRVSAVAAILEISTAQTSDFLTSEKHLLDQANRIRRHFGHTLLNH